MQHLHGKFSQAVVALKAYRDARGEVRAILSGLREKLEILEEDFESLLQGTYPFSDLPMPDEDKTDATEI